MEVAKSKSIERMQADFRDTKGVSVNASYKIYSILHIPIGSGFGRMLRRNGSPIDVARRV